MSDDFSLSPASADAALLAELGRRLTRARLSRDLTQEELAARAGVSKRTVERIEDGASSTTTNLVRLLRALDELGVLAAVAPEEGPRPFEQLRAARGARRRASPRRSAGARRLSGPAGGIERAGGQRGGPAGGVGPGSAADGAGDEPFAWGDEA